ncbi:diguanylate cyclase [Egibacter rhizosphaerae]|uniref:Diguanylate cyclase n=1 Tax=Egibacter rhizosphaerae TaxID=1670831 RepID=A0A411YHJ0_9ACTN|nr:diguanylate cyclase [Egibacter rhizosphaerae]QBI20710.1 diguanylate cyclase [Egibacter rhizosphaerae]
MTEERGGAASRPRAAQAFPVTGGRPQGENEGASAATTPEAAGGAGRPPRGSASLHDVPLTWSPQRLAEWDTRVAQAWEQRVSDPGEALAAAEALRDEAAAAGDESRVGRALALVGAIQRIRGDYPSALRALREALSRLDSGPDSDRAIALEEAGAIDSYLGEHATAVERLLEALDLHEREQHVEGQAQALAKLGMTFFHHGELDEAERAYERSLDLRKELGDAVGLAGMRNNLAKVATARGHHDAALEHLAAACAGWEKTGEFRGLAMSLHNTAVALIELGGQEDGLAYLLVAIDVYDATGHVHGACEARARLGSLRVERGELDAGIALLERAFGEANERGLREEAARAAEALADAHELAGRPSEALSWHRRLRDLERAIFDETSDLRLRTLQVHFQLDRLQRDSATDPLTGLANRRELDRRLAELAERARAEGEDLAAVLFDLDDFKRVNDEHSHAVGDEVLRAVGSILREWTRPTDLCARYGGEEFVVLLPGCELAAARSIAEGLRDRIKNHEWDEVDAGLEITVSAGVASLDRVASVPDLLGAADRALYDAKRLGKDRVRTPD